MEARDYQIECIDTVNSLPDGSRAVVVLATGLGKTFCASRFRFGKRMLWLSHRDELVRQPERYFTDQGYSFGVEKAEEHENGEDVVSASVQSIYRDERLKRFAPDEFDVIICDEAHHAAAPTYRKILSYFRPKKLIGLTATPRRGDSVRLTDVFDTICFSRDLKWGIQNGWLSRIRCLKVHADFDMEKVEKVNGDFTLSSLDREMSRSGQDLVVAKAYIDDCLPQKRQTLIYCPTVNICRIVQGTLEKMLPDGEKGTVRVLSQETPPDERRGILQGYMDGMVHCIVNCMILTEGTDLPGTSAIIVDRPSANASLYQQIIGRGTRHADGKDYCLVIDVEGDNGRYQGICTAPTLFGLDPDAIPKGMQGELEKADLLEFCDALIEERAKTARALELKAEAIDLFAEERTAIIRGGSSAGQIADGYRRLAEEAGKVADMGGLFVHVRPQASARYEIQATYEGRIRVSEPDMLGMTTMDVYIPDVPLAEGFLSFISEPMPIDGAIRITGDILKYVVPDMYAPKWSLEERAGLSGDMATERQMWRVDKILRSWGKGKAGNITKLQASDLIDLSIEMGNLERQKAGILSQIEDASKKRRGKILERWQEKKAAEAEAAEKETACRKQAYHRCLSVIEKYVKIGKEKEKKMLALIGKDLTFSVSMNYSYYRLDKSPSDKQVDFVRSLWRKAKSKRIIFNDGWEPSRLGLDMWHTGFVINFLLYVDNDLDVPEGKIAAVDLNGYVAEIQKIKKPDGAPDTISCSYRICEPGSGCPYPPMSMPVEAPEHPSGDEKSEGDGPKKQGKQDKRGAKSDVPAVSDSSIKERVQRFVPAGFPLLQVPDDIRPSCRAQVERMRAKKDKNKKFRDYTALKTGGIDRYSRAKAEKINAEIGKEAWDICLKVFDQDEDLAVKMLRWYCRGLSLGDAARKVAVDAEVAANASAW